MAANLNSLGWKVSPSTVRNIWKRHGLETSYQRLMAKSKKNESTVVLTQEEQVLLKRERRNRRVAADARLQDESVSEVRKERILLAAARVFAKNGYAQSTIKEVCKSVGIQAPSLYYHFKSKDELFATIHRLGISRVNAALDDVAEKYTDPWERLEEVCATALRFQLDRSELAMVVRVDTGVKLPVNLQRKINIDRAAYEDRFRTQIEKLPMPENTDKTLLRLTLLGALNWTAVWFKPGRLTPEVIGRKLIRIIFAGVRGGGSV